MQPAPSMLSRAEQIVTLGRLSLVSEREDAIHTLGVDGELDLATAAKLEEQLHAIEGTDADVILVDLGGLSFIDSTGIRVLLKAAARSRDDGRLALQGASPRIRRVLDLAGVAPLLPLCG